MWYVKNELGNVIYKSDDIRKCAEVYGYVNNHKKIPVLKKSAYDLLHDIEYSIGAYDFDINKHFVKYYLSGMVNRCPFNENFLKSHKLYIAKKRALCLKIGKKYHYWAYDGRGRKADGFDF